MIHGVFFRRHLALQSAVLHLSLLLVVVLAFFAPTATQANGSPPSPAPHVDVAAPAVPGEFIVKFKPNTPLAIREAVVQSQGGRVVERLAGLDIDTVELPTMTGLGSQVAAAAAIAEFTENPSVEFVEPNYIYTVNYSPNDRDLNEHWGWNMIQAEEAWNTTQGSPDTIIAVVDTGIQLNHPDLDAKIVAGYDFVQGDAVAEDGHGHGTHVAGTAAAETNNNIGGAGTCPNCRLMPIRVLDDSGSGTLSNVAKGIIFAADNGAKVINLSLGGGGSLTLQNAVNYAWKKGSFLACAAGNSNTSSTTSAYPAAYTNCFAIASTTSSDTRSSFSNYGSWVEVAAPGSAIYSSWINSGYTTISGTSMATPHVAGLAGLLASQGLTGSEIRQRLCDTADPITGTGTEWTCGRINAARAVGASTTEPATPTVTWAKPADIVYGTALGNTELNATASVPGSFSYTPAPGTVLNPGQAQTLSVVFTPADTANYESVTTTVAINVLDTTAHQQHTVYLPAINR